jgi:probable phosphoglycerate mutase
MHLFLIRHGQSYVNLKEWEKGNQDAGLTPTGQRQAMALADWLPGHLPQVDMIYASTMRRARETAIPLAEAYGQPIHYDDRIREIGNNRLDHTPYPNDALPQDFADFWASERPFAPINDLENGGEALMHFRSRVGLFMESMVANHREQVVVAVCHGGVIDVMFDNIFNIGPHRRCEVWTSNTGITNFQLVEIPGREVWRLRAQNRLEHLSVAKVEVT